MHAVALQIFKDGDVAITTPCMDDDDYYAVLGCPRSASQDELRRAYHRLARALTRRRTHRWPVWAKPGRS